MMDKYTLLLVDDEEEVIQIIIKKMDWEALGFSVVGHASNGVKALEMVEEYQPDVVMTDIKMPYMDGIELTRQIKERYPEIKILVFTGFDEFEYARESVHMGVEEYILKPINSMELSEVFTKLRAKLEQEIREKRNVETLQQYYMESLPLLQANFYSTLIEGKITKEDLEKYLINYQISLTGPFYCCLVIHTSSSQVPENINPVLLDTLVKKQVDERLSPKWRMSHFTYLENGVAIIQLDKEDDMIELTDDCDKFCRYAQRILGAVVTVGVGSCVSDILQLSRSHAGAREALSYRAIYGASRAINIGEIVPQNREMEASEQNSEVSTLFKMIRLGDENRIKEAAEKYLQHPSFSGQSLQQHNVAVMEMIGELYRFASHNNIPAEEMLGDMKQLCDRLVDFVPDVLKQWLTDTSLSFSEKLAKVRSTSSQSIVTDAKEYIYTNYADENLSLDEICRELGVSNSYFSSIFKKETGTSFIGFLTECRMEHAARLLIETDEKNYVIAGQVGYADPNYFSYVFKRQFGASPSKYRMEHTKSEK